MERWCVLFFLGIILFLIIINANILTQVTGETVTGEATQPVSMNISVRGPPSLTILSPKNETYIKNISLLLNYTVSDEDAVWYNLDSGTNTTIISSINFNTSQGSHTLYIYANNSKGTRERNVTFTVNSTKFTILYSEYNGSNKGSSTEFVDYSYEDIQNLSNIVLEHTIYGKIIFNKAINITEDANFNDNEVDFDTHTNISLNRIELNSSALPNFNKSATIWIYNLAFNNPRILRDSSVCSSSICTLENYSGGTLKFNVTGFTIYSVEETPITEIVTTTVGGGGGVAPAISRIKNFTVSKEIISITLKQGETSKESVTITNNENQKLKISITNPKLKDFIKINETSFDLNAGESKNIILDFLAREDTIPDLYIGKIIIEGDGIKKEILIAIEIESKRPIFDVEVKIPRKFLYVIPGEELITNIKIFNLERRRTADVFVEYTIKDEDGKEILYETETVFVETQTTFTKSFEIPKDIKLGKYILYVKTIYDNKVASASAWFNIGKAFFFTLKNILIIAGIIAGIVILIDILYRVKKMGKKYYKKKKGKKRKTGYH